VSAKAKAVVLVCFVAAFAAGMVVGLLAKQPPQRPRHRSWLSPELGLTDEQQEQMKAIWSEFMANRLKQGETRAALREERDRAIRELLTEEQRARYQAILDEYARKSQELVKESRKLFEQAQKRTEQILTPQQLEKFREIRSRFGPRERRRGHPGRGSGQPFGPPPPSPPSPGGPQSLAPVEPQPGGEVR